MADKFSSTFMFNDKGYNFDYGSKEEFSDVDYSLGLFDSENDYSSTSVNDCENSVFGDGFID